MTPQERLAGSMRSDRETRAKWRCPQVKIEQFQVKPFVVYAVEITESNAEEVAAWCKGTVDRDVFTFPVENRLPQVVIREEVTGNGMTHYEHQVGYVGDRVIMNPDKSYTIMHKADFEEKFEPMRRDTGLMPDDD